MASDGNRSCTHEFPDYLLRWADRSVAPCCIVSEVDTDSGNEFGFRFVRSASAMLEFRWEAS